MRLILRTDVADVGNKGDVVDVSNGYGRNYLLPRGLAFLSSPGAEAQAEGMRRSRDQKDAAARAAAESVAKTLVNNPVTIKARVGADDKLFGSSYPQVWMNECNVVLSHSRIQTQIQDYYKLTLL